MAVCYTSLPEKVAWKNSAVMQKAKCVVPHEECRPPPTLLMGYDTLPFASLLPFAHFSNTGRGPWARRWINHWSLWRMASATPDVSGCWVFRHQYFGSRIWLPSQPQGITCRPTKIYCLVIEAHVCEQVAQGCCLKAEWPGIDLPKKI